ncbi:hypothetical protein [Nocardia harenae]|uniref:hypothetical protein n=1 Tax=Nocardia harenae TaxID=358707 RepID=UPI0012EDFABB|nr:hypothetical protein [Nocardia harenae]
MAGAGNAVRTIAQDVTGIAAFTLQHCPVRPEGFGGAILDPLKGPFQDTAALFRDRFQSIGMHTANTADELNRAAWMYVNREQQNYEALNRATTNIFDGTPVAADPDRENLGIVAAFSGAANYSLPHSIALDPPGAAPPELADLIAETTGAVGDVNEAVKSVTRMAGREINILETVLSPISANWNELRRIGECYKLAGNSLEQCGDNLDSAVRQVGPRWDGRAAVAFEEFARGQSTALRWEGPVGRVISDCLTEIADAIRDGVRSACEKLRDFIASFIDFRNAKQVFKQLVKKIPGIGTALEILDLARKIWEVVDLVTDIVRRIEEMRDRVRELLEFVSNPVGKGKEWVERKLEPITSRMDDATAAAALIDDAQKIAQTEDTVNRPTTAFEVGSGRQPWENA